MRTYSIISVITLAGALAACSTGTSGTRSRTTVPPGPVSTGSASLTEIPAGTTMVIRTNEAISAEKGQTGQKYSAEIAENIVNAQGDVLVPKGSRAELTVIEATTGGAVGTSQLELALSSLTVNGRTYSVQSDVTEQRGREGLGANERTAKVVGGAAALGAVIGAVAGGGAGAVTGAAIGAAGGAAAQVLTRGEAVRVPAESLLTFRLDSPIRLR